VGLVVVVGVVGVWWVVFGLGVVGVFGW